MLTFHGYFRSSSPCHCRIAFNRNGIVPETCSVHLLKDGGEQKSDAFRARNFRARNPQMPVPALATGESVLTQSLANLEWLDEVWPDPQPEPQISHYRAPPGRGMADTALAKAR